MSCPMILMEFLVNYIDPEFYLPIDFVFSEVLLRGQTESKFANVFLMTLFACARRGHLCIKLTDKECVPKIPVLSEGFYLLLLRGAKEIGNALLVEYQKGMEIINKPIVFHENHYYLQQNFIFESMLIKHIQAIESYPSLETEKKIIDKFLETSSLNEEQKLAVHRVFSSSISIISGGPGRGKTYTASIIAKIFLSTQEDKKVIVTAPTGKATLRLQESIDIDDERVVFLTLHSLLQVQPEKNILEKTRLLGENLILVDEASMIDIKLFAKLLQSTQPGTILVFMGDENQLPPVEIGTVFSVLCDYAKATDRINYTLLHHCMRTELKSILQLSDKIHMGRSIREYCIPWGNANILDLLPCKFWQYLSSIVFSEDPIQALYKLPEMQVLSCLQRGHKGAISINKQIMTKLLLSQKKDKVICLPILITKTAEHISLINGEMGILVQYGSEPTAQDFALFSKADKSRVKIPRSILPAFEEAFVISVHKSQGSEFDSVIVLIGEGSEKFGREILYTAVTRAKKELTIIADIESVEQCIQKASRKYCRIFDRLMNESFLDQSL